MALAAGIGLLAGMMVAAMVWVTKAAHLVLFDIPNDRLSGSAHVDAWRALLSPVAGGLLLGVLGIALTRWWRMPSIDPVEANALHGGEMSIRGSLIVVLQTLVSNGFGASVGMEAGYTQAGSAAASRIGRVFRLRRSDMRTLVGCGAAGAIAAAFDAPLTGAFYAFELIIGTYAIGNLAPVAVASICAVGSMHLLLVPTSFQVGFGGTLTLRDYPPVIFVGLACAGLGILLMRGVPLMEAVFRHSRIPVVIRPMVGGLAVGLLALLSPAVLSSGHSALHVGFEAFYTAPTLVMLIGLKSLASAISIGSGFRGGLFFASLFIGAMLGKLIALGWMLIFSLQVPAIVIGIVGMSAMATAVLGGPLTMSFLALETTGSLPLTIAVLAASVVSSLTVRRTFGYSFATWRFHLRGEAIRSAADIGWIRTLTVGRMMRTDVRSVSVDMGVEPFRRAFPLGSTQRVVVVDTSGRYAGIAIVAEVHNQEYELSALADVLRYQEQVLLPQMNVREAVELLSRAEADALAVVDQKATRRVIGILTEQHALRRYNDELDRRSKESSGD